MSVWGAFKAVMLILAAPLILALGLMLLPLWLILVVISPGGRRW